jgi:hypothetical protein
MKRRDFLVSAGLAGLYLPDVVRAQAKPCPPPAVSVAGGQAASVLCGPLPAWIDREPLFRWIPVPTSNTANSVAAQPNPGGNGAFQVVDAWGGAAATPKGDVYLWGGGHWGYAGNEVYCLHLNAESPTWERLNQPSSNVVADVEYYADGRPSPRHTYQSFWVAGGKLKSLGGAYVYGSSNVSPRSFDVFDLGTKTWQTKTSSVGGNWYACGDHETGYIYAVGAGPSYTTQYASLAPDNTWRLLGSSSLWLGQYGGSAFDSRRKRIYRIGSYDANIRVEYWQLGSGPADPALTGAAATVFDTCGSYPGVDYDSRNDWILLRVGNGTGVYRLDCATLQCDALPVTGTVVNPGESAVCGRFKYVPELRGFVYVARWGTAYFLRTA